MLQNRTICSTVLFLAIGMLVPAMAHATSCTTQAELSSQDRDALAAVSGKLAVAVMEQDESTLQANLLPSATSEWEGIRGVAQAAGSLLKGGKAQLRNVYLLDASGLTAPVDTQFFCSNASGSLVVTLTMRSLPPGRYAVVLADAASAAQNSVAKADETKTTQALSAQLAFILAWDGSGNAPGWKLGGLSARPGTLEGHDGLWYWTHARSLAKSDPWSAWYSYQTARSLLVPVDFISSPNLEKLLQEQAQITNSPQNAFPYSLTSGARTWKIDALQLDETLLHADLGVVYESVGVTDPAAVRTEATAVMSALLKAQPGLRENFHGLWAYAMKDGKQTPVIELPMAQIP
jgi:hypothetical protein